MSYRGDGHSGLLPFPWHSNKEHVFSKGNTTGKDPWPNSPPSVKKMFSSRGLEATDGKQQSETLPHKNHWPPSQRNGRSLGLTYRSKKGAVRPWQCRFLQKKKDHMREGNATCSCQSENIFLLTKLSTGPGGQPVCRSKSRTRTLAFGQEPLFEQMPDLAVFHHPSGITMQGAMQECAHREFPM